jgi:hypothetical protein
MGNPFVVPAVHRNLHSENFLVRKFSATNFSQSGGTLGNPLHSHIFWQYLLDFQGVSLVPEIFRGNWTYFSWPTFKFDPKVIRGVPESFSMNF